MTPKGVKNVRPFGAVARIYYLFSSPNTVRGEHHSRIQNVWATF